MSRFIYIFKGLYSNFKNSFWKTYMIINFDSLSVGIGVIFKIKHKSQICLNRNVHIGSYSYIEQGNLYTENNCVLEVGSNTYIGEFNNIRAVDGSIIIGENCLISQHISMIASNHRVDIKHIDIRNQGICKKKMGIIIKDDVWIGANCVILPGTTVGKGCVIGAGSVVTGSLIDYGIYVGSPARLIKLRQ